MRLVLDYSSKVVRDHKNRLKFIKVERRRLFARHFLLNNFYCFHSQKSKVFTRLRLIHRGSSMCKIRNRCTITGRSRSVIRFFGLSRMQVKKFADMGFLNGVTKSSW